MPISFGGVRHLYGTSGSEIMKGHNLYDDIFHSSAGADQMYGFGGRDTVDYSSSAGRVFVSLREGFGRYGDAENDTYYSIENVIGSNESDDIFGNAADNRLEGRNGADYIYGDDGADDIFGGDGPDMLTGGEGADELYGDAGDDTLRANLQDVVLDGGDGIDKITFYDETGITATIGAGGSGTATGAGGSVSFVRFVF